MALSVCEIFYSIQGESTWSGYPCVFIRLAGCNLRCAYCDTRYAYSQGAPMEIGQILERVKSLQCGMVEVTGGEPLIQPETPLLITKLLGEGLTVLLETNGSIDIGALDPRCVRIVDIKCPSSGMAEENELRNLEKLTPQDELKFVLGNRADYEFSRDLLTSFPSLPCKKNFSPVFGSLDPRTLAEWILEDHLPVRLNLQIHKIVKLP